MFKRLALLILFGLCLSQPARASESSFGELSVKAAVGTSSIYAWTVQRQSSIDIPKAVRSGERVSIQGVVRRQNGVLLKKLPISLMIGQDDETLYAASVTTSDRGEYVFNLQIDEAWWGNYWFSVGVMTYGRPVWLVLRQALSIDPRVEMGGVESELVWRIDGVLESTGQGDYQEDISDRANDTMFLLTVNSNFNKARDASTDTQMGARGRDSPVNSRSFGDVGRGPRRSGGGRHQ